MPTGVRQGFYVTSVMPCDGKGRGRANPESPVSRPACKRWHKASDQASSQGWVQRGSITKGKLLRPQGWAARRHAKSMPVADRLAPKTKHSISPNGPKSTGSNRQGFYSRGLRELASSSSRRAGRAAPLPWPVAASATSLQAVPSSAVASTKHSGRDLSWGVGACHCWPILTLVTQNLLETDRPVEAVGPDGGFEGHALPGSHGR